MPVKEPAPVQKECMILLHLRAADCSEWVEANGWEKRVMCGRFTLRTSASLWGQLFFTNMAPQADSPRFNIAPTQTIACVHRDAEAGVVQLAAYRWGLVPAWANDIGIGSRMINARSETLDSKPSFKQAFMTRRCLIPMDGYYEWVQTPDGKQPFLIEPADGSVQFMAGLWEQNKRIDSEKTIQSCTIITTSANASTAHLHPRMPVFLQKSDHSQWLDPHARDLGTLKRLLRPAVEDLLRLTPVSQHVNSPRNEDAQCVLPLE